MSQTLRAIVLDDEEITRKTLEFVLTKFGFAVHACGTLADLGRALDPKRPNAPNDTLFIVDLNLGGTESGFDAIKAIRSKFGVQPPIVVVSGTEDRGSIAHAFELGANDFLVKPLDRQLLASRLGRYASTDQMEPFLAAPVPPPEAAREAKIAFEMRVRGVDELGVKLISPNLPSKGTVVRIESEWLAGIIGKPSTLVTIAQTWVEEGGKGYGAYAEFDASDTELISALRRWIAAQI